MSQRWEFREGWSVLLLSLGLSMVISLGIAGAGWTAGLNVVPLASVGAIVIGLMIAKSRLPAWIGHLFSLTIGFAWSFRLVTTLFPDYYTWYYRWAWLWTFIYQWSTKLVSGGVSHDNMVFVLQMTLIVWVITYLSIWFIFRAQQPWLAVVPGGVLLLVNLYYAPNDITIYLLVYLALALLLVIRFNLFTQEQIWRLERVHFNADEIRFDFLRAGALFTLLILMLAWLTPGAVAAQESEFFETLRGPWRDLQSEWSRLFASLNYKPTASVDFYGKELSLGGPRDLSEVPVLAIKAPPNARYWRAVVFDKFAGRSWENTDDSLVPFGADNETLPLFSYQARQVITYTVTLLGPSISTLPMAAQPYWVDQSARASVHFVSIAGQATSGQLAEAGTDALIDTISFARSRAPLDASDSYWANSLITQATEEQLREAGNSYPSWIAERYLQLPDVSDRVVQLAAEIAASHDNAYDKATGIERFLRSEIAYNEKIEAPPEDRDPIDYILFDLQEAYCDYYATSMAVMLRSLGIPARIVSGYAQGEYDLEREAYVVELQDAHTWVEVYFPYYGWVEFEPTAAQPAIARPLVSDGMDAASLNPLAMPTPNPMDLKETLLEGQPMGSGGEGASLWSRLSAAKPGAWILGSLVLLGVAGGTVWKVRNRAPVRLTSVGAIYHNMMRLASWAGANVRVSQTPHEHASSLGRVIPEAENPAQRIAGLYTRERYGHKLADEREQLNANHAWQRLRPRLIRRILRQHLLPRSLR
jgi:transglutaminase-like putative cysteine protease